MRGRGAAAGLILLLAPALGAQSLVSGGLRGIVRSADGTPLAGVRLTLVETALHRRRSLVTGADGAYRFGGVEPGPCLLEVAGGDSGGQRITGLRVRTGADTVLDVELPPLEAGMILDVEAPGQPADPAESALVTELPASLLRALPLRSRTPAAAADLGPWPAPPTGSLWVDGLDLGPMGPGPSPLGLGPLDGLRLVAGGGSADQPGGAALQAATRGGGPAFAGGAQVLWGPATGSAWDRREAELAIGGPLSPDRLAYAVGADRDVPGDGSRTTHGDLRLDWLPGETQRWTLRALEADGGPAGRDAALALAHRWTPTPGFVQEFRFQGRRTEVPGLDPARSWEAADALALDLGAHGLRAGLDLQQLGTGARPDAPWRRAGLFLQDDWRLAEAFTLRLGLRRDREDPSGAASSREATSPRLAFSWQASARVRLYGGHGRFADPTPLAFLQPLQPLAPPDRRESHLGLAFLPLPDLALTAEARDAEGRLLPGDGDRDRLQGLALGGRWRVQEILDLAASWTLARTRTLGPLGPQDGTLRRLRLWALWDTRDLASPWARDWTLALVGRLQSGQPDGAGQVRTPEGSAVLDLRIARAFPAGSGRCELLLDAFDLLDRTRPAAPAPADAGRRIQFGLRATF